MKKSYIIPALLLLIIFVSIANAGVAKDLAAVHNENKQVLKPKVGSDQLIPVLMYHSIAYEKGNELRVPVEKFEAQMKYLKENNFKTLTLDQLYEYLNGNEPIPCKSVVLTFDDGYEDNYVNAFPVLKKYGFKASVFVITTTVDKNEKCLNSSQLKEMQNNGIDIESHTADHLELDKPPYNRQFAQLNKSKLYLESILNKKIYYLAYPVGKWNNDTILAAKNAGYKMAFTTKNSRAGKSNGLFTLNRVRINASCSMEQFKKLVE